MRGIVFLAFSFAAIGCTVPVPTTVAPQTSDQGKRRPARYERVELRNAVLGISADELRKLLGAPAQILTNRVGHACWIYHELTIDPKTGQLDRSAHIWVANDRVDDVQFFTIPPREPEDDEDYSKYDQSKVYDRAALEQILIGRKVANVQKIMGPSVEPEKETRIGMEMFNGHLQYRQRTVNPTTGKPDSSVTVWFKESRAVRLDYYPDR